MTRPTHAVGRRPRSKLLPLDEAIDAAVEPGMHLHFTLAGGRPNGAIRELIRRFRGRDPRFTVSSPSMGGLQLGLFLLEAELVERVLTGFLGDGYPVPGPSPRAKRRVDEGRVVLEEWSLLTLVLRLRAAALGLPAMLTRSLTETDLGRGDVQPIELGDERLTLVPALVPDLAFVHGAVSDEEGNTVLAAPLGEGIVGAAAARGGAIVTTEAIVSREELRAYATLPILPAAFVRSVSVLRHGAHPCGMYAPLVGGELSYADDYDALEAATRALRGDDEGLRRHLDEWIAVDHETYRARVGRERLAELDRQVREGTPLVAAEPDDAATGPTTAERIVANAALVVAQAVERLRPDAVLAGVGLSCLSCWLAAARDEDFPPLVSELGFFDYAPQPGNPFLFAYPNLAHTSALGGIDDMLGMLVQGDARRTLAVLAGGQVDAHGNVNTSRMDGSGWLTGSGGASDIATGADAVVVVIPHREGRLVPRVDFVTTPGRNVRWIATDRALLSLAGDRPQLDAVACREGEDLAAAVARVRGETPWECAVADDVVALPDPPARDLAILRGYDPRGFFLGTPR